MAKEIPLTQGKVAIVDAEDYQLLMRWKWQAQKSSNGKTYYATNGVSAAKYGKASFHMHRIIMNSPGGLMVDHIDGDGLNNRKSNLRLATRQQNGCNRRGLPSNNTSGYIGVTHARNTKWGFTMKVNGKNRFAGGFDSPEDAARARDAEAQKHYGEFAKLNFPLLEAYANTPLV
jgi:HNH endonuclease